MLENILIYFCISQSIYYYKNHQITIIARRMRAFPVACILLFFLSLFFYPPGSFVKSTPARNIFLNRFRFALQQQKTTILILCIIPQYFNKNVL